MYKSCNNCKYCSLHLYQEPCASCYRDGDDMWEPKEEKTMKNEFTKDDLKRRMVVEFRNGQRAVAIMDSWLLGIHTAYALATYNYDLTHPYVSERDIVKVYSKIDDIHSMLSSCDMDLLWERKPEVKEVTLKEIAEKFGVDEVKVVDD